MLGQILQTKHGTSEEVSGVESGDTDKTGKGTDKTEKTLGETALAQDIEKTAGSSLKGFLLMKCILKTFVFRLGKIAVKNVKTSPIRKISDIFQMGSEHLPLIKKLLYMWKLNLTEGKVQLTIDQQECVAFWLLFCRGKPEETMERLFQMVGDQEKQPGDDFTG